MIITYFNKILPKRLTVVLFYLSSFYKANWKTLREANAEAATH